MKTILGLFLATLLTGFVANNALAQEKLHKQYRGHKSQECAVVNCNTSIASPNPPSNDSNRIEHNARYNQNQQAASANWKLGVESQQPSAFRAALEFWRQAQTLRDGPNVRDAIAQAETMITWTEGVIADQTKNYGTAVSKLLQAYKSRPELFNEGNFNYMSAVNSRYIASAQMPNASEALVIQMERQKKKLQEERDSDPTLVDARVPSGLPKSVENAIASAFSNAPLGVSDRVRKGFQAVMTKDWKVARAWFQDALNHDPGNINLKSFIVAVDQPMKETFARLAKDRHTDFKRNPLNTLNDNATKLSKEQIMRVLDAILVEASCPICRQPRAKP